MALPWSRTARSWKEDETESASGRSTHARGDRLTPQCQANRRLPQYNALFYPMPCYLCAGAIVQFGIKKVVVGEANSAPEARDFMESHGTEVVNLDMKECRN